MGRGFTPEGGNQVVRSWLPPPRLRARPAPAGGRGKTGGISDYARRLGKDEKTVRERIGAARVWTETPGLSPEFATKPKVLYEISKAPRENWAELCRSAVDKAWTVERARQAVSAIADDARAAAEAEARIAQQEAADEARWEALLTEPVAQEIDGMEGLSVRGKLAEYENRNRAYAAAEQVKRERERKHREEAEQSARQRVKDAASTFIGIYGSFGSPAARMHMKAAFLAYPHTGVEIGKDFHTAEGVRELAAMLMEYADLLDDSTADVPSIYSA